MALQLVRKSDRFCAGIFGLRLALWDETIYDLNQVFFLLFALFFSKISLQYLREKIHIVIALSETKRPLLVMIGPVISNSGQFCCNYLLIGLKSCDIISSICTGIMEHHLFMYFASRSNFGNI